MPDAEEPAGHPREAGAQRQVVAAVGDVDHLGPIHARRYHDGADRVGVPLRRPGAELEPPRLHGQSGALGEPLVAGEHVLQALLQQHREGLAQTVQHGERGRVGEVAGRVGLPHVAEVEEAARQLGLVGLRQSLLAGADDAEAGREHETLLRAGDGQVHTPLVHPEVDARDRAHAVHHEERGVAGLVQGLAHARDVAGDAGRGLVVGKKHGLDLVALVGRERVAVALDRRAFAPLGVEHLDVEAETLGHVDPEMTEHSEPAGEHLVARREGIGERGLPGAGAARREEERLAGGGLEDLLQLLEQRTREPGEVRRAVVLHGAVHGPEDPVGNVGGPGNEEMVAAGHARNLGEGNEYRAGAGAPTGSDL